MVRVTKVVELVLVLCPSLVSWVDVPNLASRSSSSKHEMGKNHNAALCLLRFVRQWNTWLQGGGGTDEQLDVKEMFPSMDRDRMFTTLNKFHDTLVAKCGKRGKELLCGALDFAEILVDDTYGCEGASHKKTKKQKTMAAGKVLRTWRT